MRLRKLSSLASPLRLSLAVTHSCLLTDWLILWVPSVEGMLCTRQGSKVLGIYQWKYRFLPLKNFLLEGWGRQTTSSEKWQVSQQNDEEQGEGVRRGGHWMLNLSADENVKNSVTSSNLVPYHTPSPHTSRRWLGKQDNILGLFQSQKKINYNYFFHTFYFLKDKCKRVLNKEGANWTEAEWRQIDSSSPSS